MKKPVLIITNSTWYTVNFRVNLAKKLIYKNHEVFAISPPKSGVQKPLEDLGIKLIELPLKNQGMNPIHDILFFFCLLFTIAKLRPLVVLSYTIKPNIYAGLASRFLKVPIFNNISGLGSVFIRRTFITRLAEMLYKNALRNSSIVFFQNQDDRDYFIQKKIISAKISRVLPGSGVDTEWFKPLHRKEGASSPFRFLLSARLLWDKGVGEFIEAARLMLKEQNNVEFQLLGLVDAQNPTAITLSQVNNWESEGVINYLGHVNDVRNFICQADCVVLPSYREGTPRSLLEAASMEKPIITTDAIGCRGVVEDGLTGFLCKVGDAQDLFKKMKKLINLSNAERRAMGIRGRKKMIKEYEETIVISQYVNEIDKLK